MHDENPRWIRLKALLKGVNRAKRKIEAELYRIELADARRFHPDKFRSMRRRKP